MTRTGDVAALVARLRNVNLPWRQDAEDAAAQLESLATQLQEAERQRENWEGEYLIAQSTLAECLRQLDIANTLLGEAKIETATHSAAIAAQTWEQAAEYTESIDGDHLVVDEFKRRAQALRSPTPPQET